MELRFPVAENAEPLLPPLASLRLLVPPLRLVAAYLWQVTQRGDAMQYGMLADFVSVVLEAIPDLLSPKHAAELILGLRARVVLELCRGDHTVAPDDLRPHLDSIQLLLPILRVKGSSLTDSGSETGFPALVQTLLQNPEERRSFFQDVFPDVCGSCYDEVLQVLMWDFLRRLEKLLPVPDLLQTASWLDGSAALAADCTKCVSHPELLKALMQHPEALARLDPPGSPTVLGGVIISLLCIGPGGSAPPTEGQSDGTCTTHQELQPVKGQPQSDLVTSEEEVVVETVTVCTQMELGTGQAQGGTGGKQDGEEEDTRGDKRRGGESQWGDVEEEDMEIMQSSGGEEEEEEENGDEVFEREAMGQGQSGETELLHVQQETHGQGSCSTSCVGEEQAAPAPVVPPGWRRSQRKAKKTWKVKVSHLQAQKQKVKVSHLQAQKQKVKVSHLQAQKQKVKVSHLQAQKQKVKVSHLQAQKQKVKAQERRQNHTNSSESSDVGRNYVSVVENSSDSHQQEALVRQNEEEAHTDLPQTAPPAGPALSHPCGACGKSYRFASELKAHQRTHTGERPFACPHCDKTFAHSQALARHRYTHGVPRLYECGRCPEVFPTMEVRNEHRRAEHEGGQERAYKCEQCPAAFPSLSGLSRHGLGHSTSRSHRCTCGKGFTHRGALQSHLRTHTSERPFLCTDCGKSFPSKSALEQHHRTHSDERPFLCTDCGKSFKRQRSLSVHVSVHTRDNILCCSQCDKTFCYKASLTRHELTHSGERPFLCDDCGKSFFSYSELQKHQRFHTGHKPFRCPVCDKSFTQSCYLTLHMRYHTGARPYACPTCPKSFCSSTRLKRHVRIHSGEKPYQCSLCPIRFQESQQLKAHKRKHHALSLDQ